MKAGRRKHKITFQRFTATQDDYGQPIETWADYAISFADVIYGSGREQREASQEQGSQAATFEVVSNSKTRDLKVTDRISYQGLWDISGVAPMDDMVRVTATRGDSGQVAA